jgi:predicted oxidoreductase
MRSEEQFSSVDQLADHLRFLLDRGVTTIDTANTYGAPYTVEEFLGKALKQVGRDKFEVITKCGIRRVSDLRPDNRIRHYDFTESELRPSVERSLNKLGIDHVDLLLLHRPDYLMDPAETGGVLDAFIAEGKTRYVGISNFSVSRHDLLAAFLKAPIVTNQVEFSPIHLDPISDGVFDLALRVGHRPMIWSPIGGGRLMTGDDERTVRIRQLLTDIAKRTGLAGPAEAAIAFVARHPVGGLPIIGSGKRERLEAAIAAVNNPLSRQDWYEIATVHSPMLEL